jgi:hypothetical protein
MDCQKQTPGKKVVSSVFLISLFLTSVLLQIKVLNATGSEPPSIYKFTVEVKVEVSRNNNDSKKLYKQLFSKILIKFFLDWSCLRSFLTFWCTLFSFQ